MQQGVEHTHCLTWLVLRVAASLTRSRSEATHTCGRSPQSSQGFGPVPDTADGRCPQRAGSPPARALSFHPKAALAVAQPCEPSLPLPPPEAASPPALGSRAGLFLPLLSQIPEDTGTGHGRVRALSSHPVGPGQDGG